MGNVIFDMRLPISFIQKSRPSQNIRIKKAKYLIQLVHKHDKNFKEAFILIKVTELLTAR